MTQDFTFDLPAELIAQTPPPRRGDSRLLLVEPGRGVVGETAFRGIVDRLRPGDRLVLNESRVLPARLLTRRQDTGGRVEILLLRPAVDAVPAGSWWAMARPLRRLRTGMHLLVDPAPGGSGVQFETPPPVLTIGGRGDGPDAAHVLVSAAGGVPDVAEACGVMPLPPYIARQQASAAQDSEDRDRYQTVYAAADGTGAGSVAAPTAGLHFSTATLAALAARGVGLSRVCLHVGPGTFQPPSAEQIQAGRLHREFFRLPAAASAEIAATRAQGGRVVAVGTTALRVLETVARLGLGTEGPDRRDFGGSDAGPDPVFRGEAVRHEGHWQVSGETRLFVRPPDRITAVDGLLTNFHLPGSSLLMLVASLLGAGVWTDVYAHAVRERLRFYSYGDCMLILPGLDAGGAEKESS